MLYTKIGIIVLIINFKTYILLYIIYYRCRIYSDYKFHVSQIVIRVMSNIFLNNFNKTLQTNFLFNFYLCYCLLLHLTIFNSVQFSYYMIDFKTRITRIEQFFEKISDLPHHRYAEELPLYNSLKMRCLANIIKKKSLYT